MGCDGGTTADSRKLLVKLKKIRREDGKRITSRAYWGLCHYSKQPLTESTSVVCDIFGCLYDKQAVLLALYEKKFRQKEYKKEFGHIRSMKDIFDVKFSINPNPGSNSISHTSWTCPLTQKAVQGPFKFNFFSPCGHVVSKKEFDDNFSGPQICPVCNAKISRTIILNNDVDTLKALRDVALEKRKEEKRKKKRKKKRKRDNEEKKVQSSEMKIEEPLKKKRKLIQEESKIPEKLFNSMFLSDEQIKTKGTNNEYFIRGAGSTRKKY